MTVCLLVVKEGDPCYVSRFGRMSPEHAAHIAASLDHPDCTIADIVVMPAGFGAAMLDFNAFCVDPEPSR